jgi:hypothetical protein
MSHRTEPQAKQSHRTSAIRHGRAIPRTLPVLALVLGAAVVIASATSTDPRPVAAAPAAQSARPSEVLATSNFDPNHDTFVSSERPDETFGSEDWLLVGWRASFSAVRSLISFDIDDLDRDQAITRAELRLTLRDARPANDARRDIVLRRVTSSWKENEATWNKFPSYDDNRLASESVGTSGGRITWRSEELTELVQAWRWPEWQEKRHRDNRGFYLQGYEAEGSYRAFDSDEGREKPELRLTHVTDDLAPKSTLAPLPEYITKATANNPNVARIPLEWTFEDPAPATGVEFFELRRQVANRSEQLIADELQQVEYEALGANGERIGFWVTAIDMAGNRERSEKPEVETLIDLSPPLVTVEPLPTFVNAPFQVRWGGVDEPQGMSLENSGIATYDVFYNINEGGWGGLKIGTTETSMFVTPADGASYAFRARAIDRAGNVQPVAAAQAATVADMRPPTVRFQPVPRIDQPNFVVRWEAIDPGPRPSGATTVDVQYRVNGGPWQDWASNSAERERAFNGAFSNVYEFRARARDTVGNLGDWPDVAGLVVGVIDPATLTSEVWLPVAWVAR